MGEWFLFSALHAQKFIVLVRDERLSMALVCHMILISVQCLDIFLLWLLITRLRMLEAHCYEAASRVTLL